MISVYVLQNFAISTVCKFIQLNKDEIYEFSLMMNSETSEGKEKRVSVLPQYNTQWYAPFCLLEVNISQKIST